jgi:hypothetical protein
MAAKKTIDEVAMPKSKNRAWRTSEEQDTVGSKRTCQDIYQTILARCCHREYALVFVEEDSDALQESMSVDGGL